MSVGSCSLKGDVLLDMIESSVSWLERTCSLLRKALSSCCPDWNAVDLLNLAQLAMHITPAARGGTAYHCECPAGSHKALVSIIRC